jgi:hypothetical protein
VLWFRSGGASVCSKGSCVGGLVLHVAELKMAELLMDGPRRR